MKITRKTYGMGFLLGAALAIIGLAVYTGQRGSVAQPTLTVFKNPSCGCCSDWIDYMQAAGFKVRVEDVQDMATIKARFHIPYQLQSCHTTLVEGYIVEGHVPAGDVWRLLQEKPDVAGLAVPGMPIGSPGMEQGNRRDPYDVLAFTLDGQTQVYARYGLPAPQE